MNINTNTSFLLIAYLCQMNASLEIGAALQIKSNKSSMNINLAHRLLGHNSKVQTQHIAKALGISIAQGSMDVCEACAFAKAKQKYTTQESQGHRKSTVLNMKVYSDLSYIYGPNQKQAYKYVWHLMIDSATRIGTDGFYKAKISFIELACQQLQKWK